MRYQVGIKIYNSFDVEADSEEQAEEIVRDFDVYKTLEDADYNITYTDKVTNEDGNGHEVITPTKETKVSEPLDTALSALKAVVNGMPDEVIDTHIRNILNRCEEAIKEIEDNE